MASSETPTQSDASHCLHKEGVYVSRWYRLFCGISNLTAPPNSFKRRAARTTPIPIDYNGLNFCVGRNIRTSKKQSVRRSGDDIDLRRESTKDRVAHDWMHRGRPWLADSGVSPDAKGWCAPRSDEHASCRLQRSPGSQCVPADDSAPRQSLHCLCGSPRRY
jgi:hypothetical protein